ncbi:hypothetical protein QYG89_14645 [Bacillus sp. B190/17]|uniref:Uncharacterized protein n=1 Tax=Bacillus lumedeiriae TaxID=3058829 RepID=A0ABW8IBL6_9BACI
MIVKGFKGVKGALLTKRNAGKVTCHIIEQDEHYFSDAINYFVK